jgi:hypothetical protein
VSSINNAIDCYTDEADTSVRTTLRLPLAGSRDLDGNPLSQGTLGHFWTASPNGTDVYKKYFSDADSFAVGITYQSHGISVRCLKNP